MRYRESKDCATFFLIRVQYRPAVRCSKIDGILDSGSVPGSINVPASWCGFELCVMVVVRLLPYNKT